MPAHAGISYAEFIERFLMKSGSRAHVEIGSRKGGSLNSIVSCPAIAVDPEFRISTDVIQGRSVTMFFQMTSDVFFESYDPAALLGRSIDTAFIDGMHLFEFCLRDFINLEKCGTRQSVIFFHDVFPLTAEMAGRTTEFHSRKDLPRRNWRAGDVWKIVPALQKYRSDLKLICLDCPPTGLLAVTNLDPENDLLRRSYDTILSEFQHTSLDDGTLKSFYESFEMVGTKGLTTEALKELFA
jgi:hypothetical protein